ncbi:hypothetical protein M0802_006529 [Mischocyttarus mexicanus]|nr:hypothetical protein M0802_006529 [Mischocyttarus mexicanus]
MMVVTTMYTRLGLVACRQHQVHVQSRETENEEEEVEEVEEVEEDRRREGGEESTLLHTAATRDLANGWVRVQVRIGLHDYTSLKKDLSYRLFQ